MLLPRTAVFCPRESLDKHHRRTNRSIDSNTDTNQIYAIAISSRTSKPTWAIYVNAKKHNRMFFSEQRHASIYLPSDRDSTTMKHSINGFRESDMLVKILVDENCRPGVDVAVEASLSKVDGACRREDWLHDAIEALQSTRVCNDFDANRFVQVATHTLAAQQEHDSVAVELDYLAEVGRADSVTSMSKTAASSVQPKQNKKQGKSYFGFWISRPQYPQTRPVRKVDSWERQDDVYGGLM